MSYERRSFSETAVDTTLSGTIDDSIDSFTIDDASGWPSGTGGKFYARIESETLLCTTNTLGTMTGVERGQNGTSPATHTAGVAVSHVACKADYDEANYAVSETVGKVTTLGDTLYADGANSLERLAKGSAGQFYKQGANVPEWASLIAATDISDFAEAVSDQVGTMVTGNTETGITVTYEDTDNTLDFVVDTEFIADTAGAMFTGNTETGITATYQDADNTVDLEVGVDNSTIEISSGNLRAKADGITASHIAPATITNTEVTATLSIPAIASGTWVPVFRQGSALTCTISYAHYQRVGGFVMAAFNVTFTNSGTVAQFVDMTLPVNSVYGIDIVGGGGRYVVDLANTRYLGTWMTSSSDATRVALDFSTLISMASFTVQSGHTLSGVLQYFVA